MKSIFILIKSHLIKRRFSNLLLGGNIMLSTSLLATSICIIMGIQKPFDQLFDKLNGSHILLFGDSQSDDIPKIKHWLETQSEVKRVSGPTLSFHTNSPLIYKGEELGNSFFLCERNLDHQFQDQVQFVEGTPCLLPGPKEIWLPVHMRESKNMQLGDSVGVSIAQGLYYLKISAFIVDPHFVSGIMNPNRAWIGVGELSFMMPIHKLTGRMIGIRLNKESDISTLWSRFYQAYEFEGTKLEISIFRQAYMSFYAIGAVVILIFGVFTAFIALLLTTNQLRSSIKRHTQEVGVLKSIGFRLSQIRSIYLIQWGFIGMISIIVGICIFLCKLKLFQIHLSSSLGLSHIDFPIWQAIAITSLLILSFMLAILFKYTSPIKKISVLQAIRSGDIMPPSINNKFQFSTNLIEHLPLKLFLALKMIFQHSKKHLGTGISFTLIIILLLFSINLSQSFRQMSKNKAEWGFEEADLSLKQGDYLLYPTPTERLIQQLKEIREIKDITPWDYYELTIPPQEDKPPRNIFGKIYGEDISTTGLKNLEGTHPKKAGQIALCIQTAEQYQKTVGDSVKVFLEGMLVPMEITGIYQDISNLGEGFRLHEAAIQKWRPSYESHHFAVRLYSADSASKVKNEISTMFGETLEVERSIEEREEISAIISGIQSTMSVLAIFCFSIMGIMLFNTQIDSIYSQKRDIKILHAIGFSKLQIRSILTIRIFIILCFSLIMGLPLGWISTPMIMNTLTAALGIYKFPYDPSLIQTCALIPVLFLFCILLAWGSSKKIA